MLRFHLMNVTALVWLATSSGLVAREYVVEASAKPGGDGSSAAPFVRIQEALDLAGAGDTVRVKPGMYRERVRFKHSGTPTQPVVLQGEPGAVIDGSEAWTGAWEPAPGWPEGVWRAKPPVEPAYVAVDGKYLHAFLVHNLATQEQHIDENYKGRKLPRTPQEVFAQGAPFAGWKIVRGTWCFHEGWLYGKLDGGDFGARKASIAPADSACVAIEGADYAVVRGLSLRHAWEGVSLVRTAGSVVEGCTVGPTARGIRLDYGARGCVVRCCEVTCPAIFEWSSESNTIEWEDLYWLNKVVGSMNMRTLSALNAGPGNIIAYNVVHDAYQGIEDKEDKSVLSKAEQAELGDGPTSVGLEVHHNTMRNIWAYGLGPNGSSVNQRWHHNLIVEAGEGMRIKKPKTGPLYIYRNAIRNRNGRTYWWYAAKDDPATAAILFYHNTLAGPGRAVYMAHAALETTPRGLMFGNILLMNQFWHQKQDPRRCAWEPWQCDGNLLWSSVQKEAEQRSAYNAHGVSLPDGKLPYDERFAPLADSPAIDAAPDAEKILERLRAAKWPVPESGSLPGLERAAGKGFDLGAVESDPEGMLPPEFTALGVPEGMKVGVGE
ncbi:MAG: hypothetical protein M5U26_20035 [Planctomycetota bacterium]|nr:hypothetical protein [Planctomycetota bacterium]